MSKSYESPKEKYHIFDQTLIDPTYVYIKKLLLDCAVVSLI